MNILVITNRLTMGGAEQFVVRLSNELARRQHRVLVVSSGGELEALLAPNLAHAHAPAGTQTPWGLWTLSRELRELLDAHAIEVIHANSPTTALAARLACGGRPIPIVTSAHNGKRWYDRGVPPILTRVLARGSDRVVGVSEELTRYLIRNGLAQHKAQTIHNGIPCRPEPKEPRLKELIRSELALPLDAPLILCVARLHEVKGHRRLIEALPGVLEKHPDARLLIAGEGPLRPAIEARIEELGIGRSVQLLGNRQDVDRLLCAADVFCLPSDWEGLPLAVAEAMAAGLPVVATAVGGVPEIVEEGVTGWLVPPADPGLLASRLCGLLAEPAQRRRMGLAGREKISAHFTLEQMVSKFEALYRELVEHKRAVLSQALST